VLQYVTYCSTLHHTATHCNTLQHTATYCYTLQHTVTQCNTLQHTATYCNTLQIATHCKTLQTQCNALQYTAIHNLDSHNQESLLHRTARHCNTLQHTTSPCNTLQHTATHCNTLQNTATHKHICVCAGEGCMVLQCVLYYCIYYITALLHVATRCNIPQHINIYVCLQAKAK